MMGPKAALVIPCFNEADRIDIPSFKRHETDFHFVFVDDGSDDRTYQVLDEAQLQHKTVIKLEKNRGKAEAVRAGVLQTAQSLDVQWMGYWDADLSTPLAEARVAVDFLEKNNQYVSVWFSRVYRLGAHIVRSRTRHYLGRFFATAIGLILDFHPYDSQCGAKLFDRRCIEAAFREPFVSKWIFDVEIGMRLESEHIFEMPVSKWVHQEGSKLSFVKDPLRVLLDIFSIRRKYGRLRAPSPD